MTSTGGSGWLVFMLIKSHWSSARESRHSWHLLFLPVYCKMYFLAGPVTVWVSRRVSITAFSSDLLLGDSCRRFDGKIPWNYAEPGGSCRLIHVLVQTDVSLMVDGAMYPHLGPLLPHWSLQHSDCSMSAVMTPHRCGEAGGNDRLVSAVLWGTVIRTLCCPDNNRALSDGRALERKKVGCQSQNMNVK